MKQYFQALGIPFVLSLIFTGIFGVVLFASEIGIMSNNQNFPDTQPTGEIQSGVTQKNFTDLFRSCGDDKLLLGYNTGTHAVLCISYDDLRKKLVDGSTGIADICTGTGRFLAGFDSTGGLDCKTLQ